LGVVLDNMPLKCNHPGLPIRFSSFLYGPVQSYPDGNQAIRILHLERNSDQNLEESSLSAHAAGHGERLQDRQ
jgi:hypothetical protein